MGCDEVGGLGVDVGFVEDEGLNVGEVGGVGERVEVVVGERDVDEAEGVEVGEVG